MGAGDACFALLSFLEPKGYDIDFGYRRRCEPVYRLILCDAAGDGEEFSGSTRTEVVVRAALLRAGRYRPNRVNCPI